MPYNKVIAICEYAKLFNEPFRTAVTEGIMAIYGRPLMEANAGDELRRGVRILCNNYGVANHETARQICLDLRHVVFDIFARGEHADASRDPHVVKVIGMFEPVLRMLCEHANIQNGDTGALERMASFGKHFKSYVMDNGSALSVYREVIDPKTSSIIKHLKCNGAEVSYDDIMSTDVVDENRLDNAPVAAHTYRIIHVPTHAVAVEQFQGKVPWCLTWKEDTYWNKYSNGGANKCYFVFRDDFNTVPYTDGVNDPKDEYGLSAIGIFIAPDGSIAHLFNRHNRVDQIYSAQDMEHLVHQPFDEAFPPFTDEEREASEAECREPALPPITTDNFYEECCTLIERQMNNGEFEGTFNILNDLSDTRLGIGWDEDSALEGCVVFITDSRDNKQYAAIVVSDNPNAYRYEDYTEAYSDWVECTPEQTYIFSPNCEGGFLNPYTPMVILGDQIHVIVDSYETHTCTMPSQYKVFTSYHKGMPVDDLCICTSPRCEEDCESNFNYDNSDRYSHPIAFKVMDESSHRANILILPNGRSGDPFVLFDTDQIEVDSIELDHDNDRLTFKTYDASDMFNDIHDGIDHVMPFDKIREIWARGSVEPIDEESDD